MFKKKRPKGTWFIESLRRLAIGSFILMMSLFVLYGVTAWEEGLKEWKIDVKQIKIGQEVVGGEETQKVGYPSVDNSVGDDYVMTPASDQINANEMDRDSIEESGTNQDLSPISDSEGSGIEPTKQLESQKEAPSFWHNPESDIDSKEAKVQEAFEQQETREVVEIPVYGEYTLNISDEMLAELDTIVATEGLNPLKIVAHYLKELETKDRLKVINFTLEKAQKINIGDIWALVADGISNEDIEIFQQVIEEHFTKEEIDMLYQQYQNYEIASREFPQG